MSGQNLEQGRTKPRPSAHGLYPILLSIARNEALDLRTLTEGTINYAIETGLGPLLATIGTPLDLSNPLHNRLYSAELTTKLLTAEMLDALTDVLRVANNEGLQPPIILKGMATAQRYYPAPHLRAMGDIDILISAHQQQRLEATLFALGYRQQAKHPQSFFTHHHHSMPFWHPVRRTWLEVHTKLVPPSSALARHPVFSPDELSSYIEPFQFGGQPASVMSHEMQLIYTCVRWAEGLDVERGVFPILDVILLLRKQNRRLDWNLLLAILESAGAAISAVHLMLSTLSALGLAPIPGTILKRIAKVDRGTNRSTRWILRQIVISCLIDRRPAGHWFSDHNMRVVWSTLLLLRQPMHNLLSIPYRVMFPPQDQRRFQLSFMYNRMRSLINRMISRNRNLPARPTDRKSN